VQLVIFDAARNAKSQPDRPVNPMLSAPAGTSVMGPHGGQVVSDGGNRFEVNINRESKKIDVYEIETRTKPPNYLEITLFDEKGKPVRIALGSVGLRDPVPHYSGELTIADQPNMGFELRFEQNVKSG
jgi:hypothetical protein